MRYLCLLPLLLSACAPTTSAGLRAMAADLDAQQAAQAEQARQAEQERRAYEQAIAQQTVNAIGADYQRLAITQTAQGIEALSGIATQAAQQTAVVASATQAVAQLEWEARRAEIDLAQRQAQNEANLLGVVKWLALFVAFCIVCILTLLAIMTILTRYRLDHLRYERWMAAVRELPAGEMVIDGRTEDRIG